MSKLSISTAWDETRAILVRDGRLLVAVALALVVLPTVVVGLIVPTPPAESEPYHAIIQIAGALVVLIGQLALIRLAIGPATSVGAAISHGASRFPALLGSMLLLVLLFALLLLPVVLILAALGTIDLSEPGRASGAAAGVTVLVIAIAVLALSVRFMLGAAVAAAEKVGPLTILKRSWALTGGHYWRLLALLLLLLVVALVLMLTAGVIGGILGAVISPGLEPFTLGTLVLALFTGVAQAVFTMLSSVMLARVYLQVSERDSAEVTVPHSGT